MAPSVPMRMNGPSGRWLVRVARCNANCVRRDERANGAREQRLPSDPAKRGADATHGSL
jgi:hypothetical protein